ncbi:hypothetical protein V5799_018053 [Amblyomma americanum]|uniref:PAZ domain-containing protein n=1 Tax=Amblyomma americanum TaxID=6943 RepID=A0AAQ4F0G1_AMBAM
MAAMAPSAVVPQQFQFAAAVTPAENGDCGRPETRRRRDEFAVIETRPVQIDNKRGTSGSPIKVLANYFRLLSMPQCCIHKYHVEFTPTVESSRMRRALLVDFMHMFDKCLVFDGMSDLKSPKRLDQDITEVISQRRTDGVITCVRFKWVQELAPLDPELLRLFNTQMRRNLERLDFVQINRHFFDRRAVASIPQYGLELWQGLVAAIGQYESGVMLVTDTLYKVLRRDSVFDLMSQIQHVPNYKDECVKRVAGCIVMTPYNNKTYRVDDIDWDKNPACTFETKEGPKTYADYYRDHYEKRIRDMRQPLLVCRPKEKDLRAGRTENIYLVPELCVLTGLTDEAEKVMQGSNTYRYSVATADFSRETRYRPLHVAVAVESWIVFCHRCEEANVTEFMRTLMSVCPPMGLNIRQPRLVLLDDDRPSGFVYALRQLAIGGNIELALIVLPNSRKDRYDIIKKEACVDLGLHTQASRGYCSLSPEVGSEIQ